MFEHRTGGSLLPRRPLRGLHAGGKIRFDVFRAEPESPLPDTVAGKLTARRKSIDQRLGNGEQSCDLGNREKRVHFHSCGSLRWLNGPGSEKLPISSRAPVTEAVRNSPAHSVSAQSKASRVIVQSVRT